MRTSRRWWLQRGLYLADCSCPVSKDRLGRADDESTVFDLYHGESRPLLASGLRWKCISSRGCLEEREVAPFFVDGTLSAGTAVVVDPDREGKSTAGCAWEPWRALVTLTGSPSWASTWCGVLATFGRRCCCLCRCRAARASICAIWAQHDHETF